MLKIEYLCDKFVDYRNKEREFILAAVSIPMHGSTDLWEYVKEAPKFPAYLDVEKVLAIGISIRHPEDKYDEEFGKRIAVGKSLKGKGKYLLVTDSGLINTKMVRALLEQEADYFKRNPESYIAGYNKAAEKWKSGETLQS